MSNYDSAVPQVEVRTREIPMALSGLQGEGKKLEQVFEELINALVPVTRPPGEPQVNDNKKQLYETEYGQALAREICQLVDLRERMEQLISRLEV